jgi:lysyl-tRNA synthetase class 2
VDKIREIQDNLKINPFPYKFDVTDYSRDIIDDSRIFPPGEDPDAAGPHHGHQGHGKATSAPFRTERERYSSTYRKELSAKGLCPFQMLDIGDIIGVKERYSAPRPEITIFLTEMTLLTKNIRPLPIVKEKDGESSTSSPTRSCATATATSTSSLIPA